MVLLTGGAGYIGSHTLRRMRNDYGAVVLDNLSAGHRAMVRDAVFVECDICDKAALQAVFNEYAIDSVIHFAAKAYVGESVTSPKIYYENNVVGSLNLLNTMIENGVKDIIFSSSCATYGIPEITPITEDFPQKPINPYGMTKLIVENIMSDYKNAYDLNFVSLRYFNVAGSSADGDIGEWHEPETHVIPLLLEAVSKSRNFGVYGTDYETPDGTCIRDYIHVEDLADAHVRAIEYLRKPDHCNFINLGTGKGSSVFELVSATEQIVGRKIKVENLGRREGDPPVLVASYDLAKAELGWEPVKSSIDNIVKSAWNWHNKLDAYKRISRL